MDPALPRGGLRQYFKQYDAVMNHLRYERPAPPDGNPPPDDNPPWWTPDEKTDKGGGESHRNDAPPKPSGVQNDVGLGQLLGAGLAMKGAQSQLAQSSIRAALPELAEPLLGEAALGEAAVAVEAAAPTLLPGLGLGLAGIAGLNYLEDNMPKEQDFMTPAQDGEVSFEVDGKTVPARTFHQKSPPTKVEKRPVTFKGDEDGLTAAYTNPKGTSYDPATQTEYIKGSVTPRDWFDDLTLIPFGATSNSQRYKQAMKTYDDLEASGQPVKRVVGHSLGGSVALEMQKNLREKGANLDSRTFGAPVMDLKPFDRYNNNAERFRHPADPVSLLDRGAKWGDFKAYSHSHAGFQGFDKQPTKNALKA